MHKHDKYDGHETSNFVWSPKEMYEAPNDSEARVKKKKSVSCITHYIKKTNFKIELTTDSFQNKNQQLKN